MKNIYTIGYEGAEVSTFIDCLIRRGVDVLIDVRELPLSRRRGFSKSPLSELLARNGIKYCHLKTLGAPKALRAALKKSRDYGAYFRDFNKYMAKNRHILKQLSCTFAGAAVVLMCFERNPAECHRSVVARELGKMVRIEPAHLQVERGDHHEQVREGARLHPRQGVSAG